MLDENDLAIAKGEVIDPERLMEILRLKDPEIVLDLLFNPILNSPQRFMVLTHLLSTDIRNLPLRNKFAIAHKAYKEFLFLPLHRQKIISLFSEFEANQLHAVNTKLKNFVNDLDTKKLLNKVEYSALRREINEIKESNLIQLNDMSSTAKETFWDYYAALVYGQVNPISKKVAVETNMSVDKSLEDIFRFTDNNEIESEFKIGQESHPIIYINQIMLKSKIKRSSAVYRMILELGRKNAAKFDVLLQQAREINEERYEANRLKEIERKAKLVEKERLEREAKRQKDEYLANELMIHRAEGYENAKLEFSEFLTNIKRAEKHDISFEVIGNFLASNYFYNDLTVGFHYFINHCFNSIDHPVITFFAKDCEFTFETSEGDFYTYRIYIGNYQEYSLTEEGPFRYSGSSLKVGSYFRKVITHYPYTSAWGLKNFLDDYWTKKKLKLVRAEFKRPALGFDFLDLAAYIYSDPTIIELIPLYFSDWKYFADGLECEGCGRPLTHPISAVKGKGPVCGDHHYKLAMSDGERVEKYIRKYSKMRLLYRDSPLIKLRVSRFTYEAPEPERLLKLIKSRRDLTSSEARAHIESYISNRY